MVDVAGGVAEAPGPRGAVRAGSWQLAPQTVRGIAAVAAFGVAVSFWKYEGLLSNVMFTAGVTLALAALLLAATRRLLPTTVAMVAFIGLVNFVADAKHDTLGMVLHAYDIVFYLGSWSTVSFLWWAARWYVAMFVVGAAVAAAVFWIAWRLDGTRVRRSASLGVALLAATIGAWSAVVKPERRQTQFYWDALYVSSFYSSWAETLETLWRGQLVESATAASAPPFVIDKTCTPATKPPHIVLIHQESSVQPSLFPRLAYDRSVDPFFLSDGGRLHKMRVETYGGASWLTEFSLLTGLSTHSFGGMRPFVQSLLAGKVRDTLPEALARCGYRNVLFYPMLRNFVSNGRFYDAIGLKEIYDLAAQKAPSAHERDRFYYMNALAEMERHIRSSAKPLFTFIQTMSAHWPYDHEFAPEMKVAGGGPGTDAEMHEYLRRLSIARIDLDELEAELKRRFPNEPILIVHYGDHHPMATRKLIGYGEDTEVEDVTVDHDSIGFLTYYAVKSINHAAPPLPSHDVVDVPYLGAIVLQQAGLPLTAPTRERLELMDRCEGRYHTCKRRNEVLSFHRRLIDSRLIDSR